jgi:hypothetical protein
MTQLNCDIHTYRGTEVAHIGTKFYLAADLIHDGHVELVGPSTHGRHAGRWFHEAKCPPGSPRFLREYWSRQRLISAPKGYSRTAEDASRSLEMKLGYWLLCYFVARAVCAFGM